MELLYSQFEGDLGGFKWIKDEYVEKYFDRWNRIRKINNAFVEEVQVR